MVGQRLGPYEIVARIGAGGMGEVYRARDIRLGREVAIKVLPPELAEDPGRLHRFEQEARATAALAHPNVLALYDVGTHEGKPYLVEELLEGETLRARLRSGALTPRKATEIAIAIAHGLAAAHAKGIVHRDLKPENVFLTKDGGVKILDFGLAKLAEPKTAEELAHASTVDKETRSGAVLGTLGYLSPEQSRGHPVDARSDLFAFGCLLHEMLAGERPFRGETAIDLVTSLLRDDPPPLPPEVPAPLRQLVLRCLEKQPEERFFSAHDLALALALDSGSAGPGAVMGGRTVPPPHLRRWLVGLVLAALAVLLGAGVFLWVNQGHGSPPGASGPIRIVVLPFENLGTAEDAYFADGVSDEVRGKLANLPGLAVIARTTSYRYRNSSKPIEQIADELDVSYLLMATVRWERRGSGTNRIRVTPELVENASADRPITRWQESFDSEVSDVFRVQAQIASWVVAALSIALGSTDRARISERPTDVLAAYDAYLRGQEITAGMTRLDPDAMRRAIPLYEQAVTLDPAFALAWARLAHAESWFCMWGGSAPRVLEEAESHARRALELAPDLPEARLASGVLRFRGRSDPKGAIVEFERGLARSPLHVDLLANASFADSAQLRSDRALLRAERALSLDPQSSLAAMSVASALFFLGRFDEAAATYERSAALDPANPDPIMGRAVTYLAQGDLGAARAFLALPRAEIPPSTLVAYMAMVGIGWALSEPQLEQMLRLSPADFADSRARWGLGLAEAAHLLGDASQVSRYATDAAEGYLAQIAASPDDSRPHAHRAIALAYLERRQEARRECERGESLLAKEPSTRRRAGVQYLFAWARASLGDSDRAIDLLEEVIAAAGPPFTPARLAIDPHLAPLRRNPRFEKLLARPGGGP